MQSSEDFPDRLCGCLPAASAERPAIILDCLVALHVAWLVVLSTRLGSFVRTVHLTTRHARRLSGRPLPQAIIR